MPSRILSAIAISSLLVAFPAQSQESLPLSDPIKQLENLPNNFPFEILDFRLLMTLEEFDSAVDDGKYDVRHHEAKQLGLRDRRGNQVVFKAGRFRADLNTKVGYDKIDAYFTSPLSGQQVYAIQRYVQLEPQVAVQDILDGIIAKYGEPAFVQTLPTSQDIRYQFANGKLLTSTENQQTPEIKKCWYASGSITTVYRFSQERENRFPSCNGGVSIRIDYGARNDLARAMEIKVWNNDLDYKNRVTQDQFLLDALLNETNNKTGGKAPKF